MGRKEERGGGKELNSEKCRLLHMTVMGISYDPPSIILCDLHVNMYSKGCKVQPGFSLVQL